MIYKVYRNGSNYAYLIYDEESSEAVTIDPIAPQDILREIEKKGLKLKAVFNTHGHYDHISGNAQVIKETNALLYIHKAEGLSCDIYLEDGKVMIHPVHPLDVQYANAVAGTLGEWETHEDEEAYRGL